MNLLVATGTNGKAALAARVNCLSANKQRAHLPSHLGKLHAHQKLNLAAWLRQNVGWFRMLVQRRSMPQQDLHCLRKGRRPTCCCMFNPTKPTTPTINGWVTQICLAFNRCTIQSTSFFILEASKPLFGLRVSAHVPFQDTPRSARQPRSWIG
jgi:hypothetical protein